MVTVETRGLTKSFGDVDAVLDLDLAVDEGEVFGFLGPNGAGKSTIINLLLDYIRPTGGSVEVFGMDAQEHPAKIRERVGVLPEGYGFDDPLTGREYLEWAIRTKDADDDPAKLLDLVSLTDDAARMAADGTTVFFSSHHLTEVEAVCDRVGVMNEGELVAVDSIDGLRDSVGGHATLELRCATPPTDLGVAAVDGVVDTAVEDHTLTVTCGEPTVKVDAITYAAERADIVDIRSTTVSLETLFNELTEGGHEGETPAEAPQ